jgi:two-component system CAI-1 autoinducer sensor kinase/phosphatase CqsS
MIFFLQIKKGGTGLGLPFCKRVMLSFGGDVSCKSAEGEGVEFCLNFSTN